MFKSGHCIEGQMVSGKVKNQKCKIRFVNGDLFNGQVSDDFRPSGFGVYQFANGDEYEGEFKGGRKQGAGTLQFANGDKYIGGFEKGEMGGKGVYKSEGIEVEGWFENGELERVITRSETTQGDSGSQKISKHNRN